jgi:hypothetical protein
MIEWLKEWVVNANWFLISIAVIFHILDNFFTVIYLKKVDKVYHNAHTLEVNFHKYLFKKLGYTKGGILALSITTPILILLCVWYSSMQEYEYYLGVITGMCFILAYRNFLMWKDFEKDRKTLIKREECRTD